MTPSAQRRPRRIGPWRLLEMMTATLALRGTLLGGGDLLPRAGLPDEPAGRPEPDVELPGSYLSDSEQQQAVQRERARRFVRTRRRQAEL
jgi:hypothetical protein